MTPPPVSGPVGRTVAVGLDTPIGRLRLESDGALLLGIHLPTEPDVTTTHHGVVLTDPADAPPVLREATEQLRRYFGGGRGGFELPLALAGTAFQRSVWAELARIPYGETITYGELARRVGRPRASRAVGRANGRNPVPIVVPCHRVVAHDGIGGYGGGLAAKRALLALEGVAL